MKLVFHDPSQEPQELNKHPKVLLYPAQRATDVPFYRIWLALHIPQPYPKQVLTAVVSIPDDIVSVKDPITIGAAMSDVMKAKEDLIKHFNRYYKWRVEMKIKEQARAAQKRVGILSS